MTRETITLKYSFLKSEVLGNNILEKKKLGDILGFTFETIISLYMVFKWLPSEKCLSEESLNFFMPKGPSAKTSIRRFLLTMESTEL